MYNKIKVQGETTKGNVNWLVIFDRSGSMWGNLSALVDDLQEMVRTKMNAGDTLSAAWFSSENGQYDWFLKAHVIGDKSVAFVNNLLEDYRDTVAMTCFSEVLESAKAVAEMVKGYNATTNLVFLTDGHPVVSNTAKEEAATLTALEALNVDSALFIGYGSYYNKNFMTKMALATNGTLVHASSRKDVSPMLADFMGIANPMVAVDLVTGDAFYITSAGVYSAKLEADKVYVPATVKEVYYEGDGEDEDGLYAAAYLKMTRGAADEALQLLGKVGDIRLVDIVNTAFTNEEYGNAEKAILEATLDGSKRYLKGRNTNYLPDPNAFCVLNLLNILSESDGVYFLPRHPEFQYQRTGVKRIQREGYPPFVETSGRTPFNTLVWHGSRANVSIQARIGGYVELGPEAGMYGLSSHYPCERINTYTIIKDGVLNVDTLVVEMPDSVAAEISMNAVYLGENVWVLDLKSIPVLNQKIAKNSIGTIGEYLDLAAEELELEAAQKVYGYFRDLLNPNRLDADSELNEQQQLFLKEKGIVRGVFSPPTDAQGFEDVYLAKEIVVQRKGFSSFPSVEKVKEAIIGNSKLNPAGQFMQPYVQSAMALSGEQVEARLKSVKSDLRRLRKPMYLTRFAIVVGKVWFTDIGREAQVGDWSIKLKETEVKF